MYSPLCLYRTHRDIKKKKLEATIYIWSAQIQCDEFISGKHFQNAPTVHDAIPFSLQSVAVEGYETGEHAPGLKLKGTGAYKAAHNIIKVNMNLYVHVAQSRNTSKLHVLQDYYHMVMVI